VIETSVDFRVQLVDAIERGRAESPLAIAVAHQLHVMERGVERGARDARVRVHELGIIAQTP
jgi:hypothetical protein